MRCRSNHPSELSTLSSPWCHWEQIFLMWSSQSTEATPTSCLNLLFLRGSQSERSWRALKLPCGTKPQCRINKDYFEKQLFSHLTSHVCSLQVFVGNMDNDSTKTNLFDPPITAQYIRIIPVVCRRACTLRMELVGCELNGKHDKTCSTASTCTATSESEEAVKRQIITGQLVYITMKSSCSLCEPLKNASLLAASFVYLAALCWCLLADRCNDSFCFSCSTSSQG